MSGAKQLLFGGAVLVAGALVWWIADSSAGRGPRVAPEPPPPAGIEPATPLAEPRQPAPAAHDEPTSRKAAPQAEAPRPALVFGTFLDQDGAPVGGTEVVSDGPGEPRSALVHLELFDELGGARDGYVEGSTFRAHDLAPGDWTAYPTFLGWHSEGARIEDLASGEERRVDLVFTRNPVIEVAVRSTDGTPFDGIARKTSGLALRGSFSALVPIATEEPPGNRFPWRSERPIDFSGVGRFHQRRDGDPPELLGRLELCVDSPVHVALLSHEQVIAAQLVAEPIERVEFSVDRDAFERALGSLRLRFLDPNGEPRRDAKVELAFGTTRLTLVADGREWTGLPAGRYTLRWDEGGLHRWFELGAGERLDLGDVPVREKRELTCTVRLADGAERAEDDEKPAYLLFVHEDASGGGRVERGHRLKVGNALEFGLSLAPELYRFQWRGGGLLSRPFVVDLREEAQELEVLVDEPALLVLVPPRECNGLMYAVRDAQGIELERGRFGGPFPARLELPPGTVRIAVEDSTGHVLLEREATLGAKPTRLELEN